ncbi:DUF2190 family protein [Candidatus Dojkabacteria bacterium]|jgi:predicted RecA/RadA family phage recombinase|nr:DUF2190 family protein [Candidatus Dojkabacteria bacterium]
MANEAVIIELGFNGGRPIERTCLDAVGITKGALLQLQDPNTASGANLDAASGQAFAGIAAMDKVASDGSTTISCYTSGVFDLKCNASVGITAGAPVCLSGTNLIRVAAAGDLLTGAVIGYAEETASASEVVRVRLLG